MTDVACSRCRQDRTSAATVAANPASGVASEAVATWASVAGRHVCPACQTDGERREVAQRIASAIQDLVRHRDAADVPPDEVEVPLVEYAMRVREGARSTPGDAIPQERGGADQSGPLTLRVVVTGAFLTGHTVSVRLERYSELQRRLLGGLGSSWHPGDRSSAASSYQSGGGFSDQVPLVIARRQGLELLRAVLEPTSGGARGSSRATLQSVTPVGISVDVYDLGVAVLTADLDVHTRGADWSAVAREVRELTLLEPRTGDPSGLVRGLKRLAEETAQQYGRAVVAVAPEELREGAWRSADLSRPPRDVTLLPVKDTGRLLWLHPVHVVHSPKGAGGAETVAAALAPRFESTVHLDGGGVFAAGIGWSAVAVPAATADRSFHYRDVDEPPLRLTRLHWAYYALYMEIDRVLLAVLDAQRWRGAASLGQLEADADDIAADQFRLMSARARLDSRLGALGGDELAIWTTIAQVQGFEALREAVERKLDVLDKLAQRRVAQATQERERRTTNILGTLTILTVVGGAGGLIGVFLSSPPTSGSLWLRVLVIAGSLAAAIILYWLAYLRTARTPVPYGGSGTRRR